MAAQCCTVLPYLSVLEVCTRQSAIQIDVYLYLTLQVEYSLPSEVPFVNALFLSNF